MSQLSFDFSRPENLYNYLVSQGYNLRESNGTLYVSSSNGGLSDSLKKSIRDHKDSLVNILQHGLDVKIHLFEESLKVSEDDKYTPFLEEVYRRAFYNYHWSKRSDGNTESQHRGIDRVVYLTNDKVLRIDEKIRPTSFYDKDILLEYLSNHYRNAPGWIEKDLAIDYLSYVFWPIKKVYIFPWQQLKGAWIQNKEDWSVKAERKAEGFDIIPGRNPGYTTYSIAVPVRVLLSAIQDAMVVHIPNFGN